MWLPKGPNPGSKIKRGVPTGHFLLAFRLVDVTPATGDVPQTLLHPRRAVQTGIKAVFHMTGGSSNGFPDENPLSLVSRRGGLRLRVPRELRVPRVQPLRSCSWHHAEHGELVPGPFYDEWIGVQVVGQGSAGLLDGSATAASERRLVNVEVL
jgi:hypothetical protein